MGPGGGVSLKHSNLTMLQQSSLCPWVPHVLSQHYRVLFVVTRTFFVFDRVFAVTFVSKPQSILSRKSQLLQCGHGLVKGTSISLLSDFNILFKTYKVVA